MYNNENYDEAVTALLDILKQDYIEWSRTVRHDVNNHEMIAIVALSMGGITREAIGTHPYDMIMAEQIAFLRAGYLFGFTQPVDKLKNYILK